VKALARSLNVLIVLVLVYSSPLLRAGFADDIAVVVREDTPVDDMSMADIRKLLLGERQFWNGSLRVTLLIREPGTREREVVLKNIYRMSESEFRRYWIEKIFRAEAQTGPKIAYSNDMATQLVGAIPGSIAFVDASRIPKNLKELKIDGRLPGEKGYALK
jgi:ABC-type phosphate transport system substrate-binding protein